MNDFAATVERMRTSRLALVASLPCSTCEIDSKAAQECKLYELSGCKHLEPLLARRRIEEMVQNRRSNLLRAGIDAETVDADEKLQMVLRDTLEPWKAIHAVRRAMSSKSLRFLILGGDHRTGKTLALHYLCAVKSKAVYIHAQQLGRINQDMQRWIDTEVLCVNELGREHIGNGYTASNLDELMAEREYGRKLTAFASNMPLRRRDGETQQALADRYGDLFASRIDNRVGAYVVCTAGAVDVGPSPNNPQAFHERGEK